MDLSELKSQYRSDADDKVEPYSSSGAEVTAWINEAEEEAAIRARLLHESVNPDICLIEITAGHVTAGTRIFPLHSAVFHITRAVFTPTDSTTEYELQITDRVVQDRVHPGWRSKSEIPAQVFQNDTTLELGCRPISAGFISIECYRTPLVKIEDSTTETPEINRVHHRFLIHWVLHRAYSRPDSQIYDPKRSELEEARFTQQFGIRPDAGNRRDVEASRPHANRAW